MMVTWCVATSRARPLLNGQDLNARWFVVTACMRSRLGPTACMRSLRTDELCPHVLHKCPDAGSRIVEATILAVGGFAGGAAAEVAGRAHLVVAFLAEKLDEPGLVLDFLVEDAGGHVVGARILAEGEVAHFAPSADGAALGFEQNSQDVRGSGVVGQVGVGAAGAIG